MANEVVCCTQCGRDTANKTKICSRCYGGSSNDEQRGRKARSSQVLSGTPLEDFHEESQYDPNADERYHGGSIRDDI